MKKAAHRLIQGGIQAIPAAHHQSHVQVRSCAVPQGEAVDGTYMQVQVVLVAGAEVQEETRVTMMEAEADAVEVPDAEPMVLMAALVSYS